MGLPAAAVRHSKSKLSARWAHITLPKQSEVIRRPHWMAPVITILKPWIFFLFSFSETMSVSLCYWWQVINLRQVSKPSALMIFSVKCDGRLTVRLTMHEPTSHSQQTSTLLYSQTYEKASTEILVVPVNVHRSNTFCLVGFAFCCHWEICLAWAEHCFARSNHTFIIFCRGHGS